MVIVVINGAVLPDKELLINDLSTQIPEIRSIVLNINTNQTNIIMGEENKVIYGPGTIRDYIGNLKFQISPLSFFQVNPIQAEVLYNKAVEFAMLSGEETVFDLYSGTGTIALFMAAGAKRVYGIEAVKEAVADADINKNINGISNAEFIAGEVEKTIGNLSCRGVKADVVVVDPPRKGCEATALDSIASMKPTRIVYVSCNPATLARDLAHLSEHGYEPCEVQPVDMFPWTTHVECVTLMSKVEK
jgi:23S rRNA (uracil1939-C5)-methyltransferase